MDAVPSPFKHLVVLMMENRSFDHYLGSLSLPPLGRTDISGLTVPLPSVPDETGQPVASWDLRDETCGYPDPPHGYGPAHADYNEGKNDGFVKQYRLECQAQKAECDPRIPMGYYTQATLPVLYNLAAEFTVCDAWFSCMLSSTWPNRKYLHTGSRDADNDTQSVPRFPGFGGVPFYNFLEDQEDPDNPHQRLTWKCYFSDVPFLGFWYKFAASHAVHNFTHVADFVTDCREDRLPTISIIDPPFSLADDHPSHDIRLGQKFIGLIVDALTHSDSWETSALVILYDENGGFFDHVPPPAYVDPAAGPDDRRGFRVPALVVSPYAKKGGCHTQFDHTSIMKSVSERWQVSFPEETYGERWGQAASIWESCFDFTSVARPVGVYTGVDPAYKGLNWGSGIQDQITSPAGILESLMERIFVLPDLKVLDRRPQLFNTLDLLEHSVIDLKRMV